MPIEITMPRLSDTMEEGTLVKWNVKVGDKITSGDVLADVETDKATMELQAFDDGTMAAVVIEEGGTVEVGGLIAVLAEEGESVEDAAKAAKSSAGTPKKKDEGAKPAVAESASAATATAPPPPATAGPATGGGGNGRIKVSPVARRIAEEKNLDLRSIRGTGPSGRIIKRDVLGAEASAKQGNAVTQGQRKAAPTVSMMPIEEKRISVSNMRKTIANRLVESKTTIPHFTVTVNVDADPLLAVREQVNTVLAAEGVKLSVNDYIVRACAIALSRHQAVNSSWAGDAIQQPGTINIGVAVALPEEKGGGLVVPTLYHAHTMDLRTISSETRRLAAKAREQGLTLEEMTNGTFTISNLGMFGVEHFEAIINPPQAAILAIGAATEQPVVRNGQVTVGHIMTLTLSGDHRVIDGAMGAEFLNTLKTLLENPAGMLV